MAKVKIQDFTGINKKYRKIQKKKNTRIYRKYRNATCTEMVPNWWRSNLIRTALPSADLAVVHETSVECGQIDGHNRT